MSMRCLYSASQCSQLDKSAHEEFCYPPFTLMEEAALSAFDIIKKDCGKSKTILFAAGCGNNGADALSLARIMYTHGFENIKILALEGNETKEREAHRLCCQRLGLPFVSEPVPADVLVDGLLGVGLRSQVREKEGNLIRRINEMNYDFVISLDVPSGLSDRSFNPSVRADKVISFGLLKRCLYAPGAADYASAVVNADLSYPAEAVGKIKTPYKLHTADEYERLQLRKTDYKVSRGRIAVIGGCEEYRGAVRLASRACFSAAGGMVTVFTDPAVIDLVSCDCGAGVMVRPFEDFASLSSGFDAVLCGPGLSQSAQARAVMRDAEEADVDKLILDADAIRLYSGSCRAKSLTLTPHPGEYRALTGKEAFSCPDDFFESLLSESERLNAVIVYKAEHVYVASGGIDIAEGCNPALGVAGSGDVLAGLIAAAEARGESVLNAVLLHQLAGAELHRQMGYFSADDLLQKAGQLR